MKKVLLVCCVAVGMMACGDNSNNGSIGNEPARDSIQSTEPGAADNSGVRDPSLDTANTKINPSDSTDPSSSRGGSGYDTTGK